MLLLIFGKLIESAFMFEVSMVFGWPILPNSIFCSRTDLRFGIYISVVLVKVLKINGIEAKPWFFFHMVKKYFFYGSKLRSQLKQKLPILYILGMSVYDLVSVEFRIVYFEPMTVAISIEFLQCTQCNNTDPWMENMDVMAKAKRSIKYTFNSIICVPLFKSTSIRVQSLLHHYFQYLSFFHTHTHTQAVMKINGLNDNRAVINDSSEIQKYPIYHACKAYTYNGRWKLNLG